MKTAIQQMMIGPLCKNYKTTKNLLEKIKTLGFSAIELNNYMLNKTSIFVKILTKLAGMPMGSTGKLDWLRLIEETGMNVASLHTVLNSLEKKTQEIVNKALSFRTKYLVITGLYGFDYSSEEKVKDLCQRLNKTGEKVSKNNLMLLYHNHNIEFYKIDSTKTCFEFLMENLDPRFVNFELDTFWALDAGVDIFSLYEKLGSRIKLHHINDRGFNKKKRFLTPIQKANSKELGTGCVDLKRLLDLDKKINIDYVVLESHKNFINNSRFQSIEVSARFLRTI